MLVKFVLRKIALFSLLWTLLVVFLSLLPSSSVRAVKLDLFRIDKIAHFTFYFVHSILYFYFFAKLLKYKYLNAICVLTFAISLALGTMLEFAQKYSALERTGDINDLVFNYLGAYTGSITSYLRLLFVGAKT